MMKSCLFTIPILVVLALLSAVPMQAQEKYLFDDKPLLQMTVYIMGEINRPGEYMVKDQTNVLELIAKAGGGTQYANLKKVKINRFTRLAGEDEPVIKNEKKIIELDLADFLKNVNNRDIPVLEPNDVIYIPKNTMRGWKNVASILRDVAVVASAYFLYLRATQD
jgi:protein involved in polysaccharide export with SLBB domain